MKIRSDFVTNSSSSSLVLVVAIIAIRAYAINLNTMRNPLDNVEEAYASEDYKACEKEISKIDEETLSEEQELELIKYRNSCLFYKLKKAYNSQQYDKADEYVIDITFPSNMDYPFIEDIEEEEVYFYLSMNKVKVYEKGENIYWRDLLAAESGLKKVLSNGDKTLSEKQMKEAKTAYENIIPIVSSKLIKYGDSEEIEEYFRGKLDNYKVLNNDEIRSVMNGTVYDYQLLSERTEKLDTSGNLQTIIQDYPKSTYPYKFNFYIEDGAFYRTTEGYKNNSGKNYLLEVSSEEQLYLCCYKSSLDGGAMKIGSVITKEYYREDI